MATSVIMPALGMAQESGILMRWLKHEGDSVTKSEPLMEIETDKATVEIEATASGVLGGITAHEGDVVPVGQTIAWILAAGEQPPAPSVPRESAAVVPMQLNATTSITSNKISHEVSPLARNIADEHGIDLSRVRAQGHRIEKADVLAYIRESVPAKPEPDPVSAAVTSPWRLAPASPKARRSAVERGVDIASINGSGPHGAVLFADLPNEARITAAAENLESPSAVWRIMAERVTASWTTVPHFYLIREVSAVNLIEWHARVSPTVQKTSNVKLTYTDLFVKLIGVTLRQHPRLNSAWENGKIQHNPDVNVGIAVAIEDGLIVPVIRHADAASIGEIAARRNDLVERAHSRKIRPEDVSDGTFTLTNLGMYNVDAFSAIVNAPQAAILAVGRIAQRVVALDGNAAIRPMMTLSLSCDHRVVDGARGAKFLDDLANLIEDPWRLLS